MLDKPSFKQQLLLLRIIHFALMGGLTIFGVVVYWLNSNDPVGNADAMNEAVVYLPGLLFLAALPLSFILFKQQVKPLQTEERDLRSKLAGYQTAHIVRLALLEGAGLFAAVISMQLANVYLLGVLAAVLVTFLFLLPTPYRISVELKLNQKEREQLIS